jgi:dTDP-4-amino-4,6-dideoxygalactose transaminase
MKSSGLDFDRSVIKMQTEKIYVTKSSMPPYGEYIEAIKPLWESRWLTNMGCYHMELENRLKEYLDVPYLSLMVNGHMALEMAIQVMDFPEGGEVITTPFTFISTTHAIIRNHLTPIFCDVKLSDGTMDETKIEELITEKTVAIIPVHVYGNICNVEEIQRIANKYGLKVIYDAAHAFGVKYNEKGIGGYGDASIFSFHATKVFHTIEGGAVAFTDPQLYERLYNLKNFGIRGEELVVSVGANAKMNEFAAIMGLCNLRHIDNVIEKRKLQDREYREDLTNIKEIRFFQDSVRANKNYGYFPVLVEENGLINRDKLYDHLKSNNYYTRKYFYPLIPDQICFGNKYKDCQLEAARKLSKEILVLPLYEEIEKETVKDICSIIKEFCG